MSHHGPARIECGGPGEDGVDVDVAIIGAGFGGLCAAIRLQRAGFTDYLVFDAGDDVGGTWRDNSYPGCACDVPSHLYSFSFAPNPNWSDTFSGQREIWEYLRACADGFGIRPRLRLRHEVLGAEWDERERRWIVATAGGEYRARVLISAAGPLSDPSIPDIPGLADFRGTVFHSARWRHDHDLAGRRVAVIGTGASAVQFVPQIQPVVRRLTLFQRTPAWVVPRLSRRITRAERFAFRHVPGAQRAVRAGLYLARDAMAVGFLHPRINRLASRVALRRLHRAVPDPELRAKLTPGYTMGCKRVLVSNDYYPALGKDNVDVVTAPIARLDEDGVVTADGAHHPADTLILGTGFHVTDPPIVDRVRGRGGRLLAEAWTPNMRAYRGTAVAGFPNLFLLLGPNTGLGHTSVVLMMEAQVRSVVRALRHMRARGCTAIEPTPQAQRRWNDELDEKMAGTVWMTGCSSWYLDASGRNTTVWPGYVTGFRLRTRGFRADDYTALPAATPVRSRR
jgi:cation diffusion facilitator CzcD-associated flavoprotein CzcO